MIDNNNILLITDYEDIAKVMLQKLVLLREKDSITVCNSKNAKKILKIHYVVLLFYMKFQTIMRQQLD